MVILSHSNCSRPSDLGPVPVLSTALTAVIWGPPSRRRYTRPNWGGSLLRLLWGRYCRLTRSIRVEHPEVQNPVDLALDEVRERFGAILERFDHAEAELDDEKTPPRTGSPALALRLLNFWLGLGVGS